MGDHFPPTARADRGNSLTKAVEADAAIGSSPGAQSTAAKRGRHRHRSPGGEPVWGVEVGGGVIEADAVVPALSPSNAQGMLLAEGRPSLSYIRYVIARRPWPPGGTHASAKQGSEVQRIAAIEELRREASGPRQKCDRRSRRPLQMRRRRSHVDALRAHGQRPT